MKKFTSAKTLPLTKLIHTGRLTVLLFCAITLFMLTSFSNVNAQEEVEDADGGDMLAYVSSENHLILYDPRTRTDTILLDNVSSFVLGRDGRIAFTRLDENDRGLYIFDPSTPDLAPINISQNPDTIVYPLDWSPDGRYLAFASFIESGNYSNSVWIAFGGYIGGSDDQSLYVWDGEATTNVMPDNPLDAAEAFFIDWSYDGRLAFTVQYGWSNLDIPSETYVWDGSATTNLSQNPEYWDGVGSWSRNGQLLFASQRDDENGIYVWDGVSFRDGAPDVNSFIRVASDLLLTGANWTDEGFVAFELYTATTGTKEIILWDLEARAIARRIPVSNVDSVSRLAEGGQVILSSRLASGIPSYYLDVENTEGEILFSTHTGEFAWSSAGYLAYCGIEGSTSRILSIWNGEETWVVANVSYRPVRWQNGEDTFSCNNG